MAIGKDKTRINLTVFKDIDELIREDGYKHRLSKSGMVHEILMQHYEKQGRFVRPEARSIKD